MNRRIKTKLLLASIAIAPLASIATAPATAQSVISPSQEIVLSIGRGELVTVPGTMADVFISNDKIADVQVKSQRQLYVFGKAGGEATVYASNARGDVVWSANVRVGSNIGSIDQMLGLAMPEAKINVATMGNNTVLLTGTVAAPEDAAEAQALVEAFVGEGTNVVSRLRMATPLQVSLHVRIAEVSRSVVRTLGINMASIDGTSGFRFGVTQGDSISTLSNDPVAALAVGAEITTPIVGPDGRVVREVVGTSVVGNGLGSTFGAAGNLLGLDIAGALDLAETEGLVTTLAQPNLTAISGETAEFLVGGEFPIPISEGFGQTTIQYKNYGVSLSYTPTVLSNGRISIRVRPEVSELSSQGAIQINGFQVPGLTTRRAETTVELGSGQAFMIAGLLSNSAQNQIDKAPGLGDVPILGNLFRSSTWRRGESELVIVVTPYLVKPVNDRDIHLPTDGYLKPTEGQRLLKFQNADGMSGMRRPGPTVAEQPVAAPQVSQSEGDAPEVAQPTEARRNEKTAAATPGFSFE